jgi:hypothetical protein
VTGVLPWVLLFLAIAIVGLALIGLVCWRLFGKVRMLGREMATAAERFAELQEALDSVLASSAEVPPGADVAVPRTGNGQVQRARSFDSGSRADRH